MDVRRVAPQIHQLSLQLPGAEWLTTVYLVTEGGGAVIEPGPAAAVPFVRQAMRELGMTGIAYIIPTHIHLDHAGAIGTLARIFPESQVVLHPIAVRHAVDPTRLVSSYRQAFGDGFESVYGNFTPVPEYQAKAARDCETIRLGGKSLQVIFAPGHADHHMALFDAGTGALFCGEALGVPFPGAEHSPIPGAAPPSFNPEIYLKTAEALCKLRPRILLYSHFGPGLDPEALVPRMMENTRMFGDMVREGLNRGEGKDVIAGRIREHFQRYRGVTLEKVDGLVLDGFIHYFRKSGLVREREGKNEGK